ncbi:predicted protein [Postia placenta Mad-698-R]|nr:predicted protein [Postia placenta Mad-698-R]
MSHQVSGRIQGYSALAVDAFITLSLTENLISRVIAFVIGRAILILDASLVQLLVIVTYKPNGTQAMDGVYCFAGTSTLNARRPPLNATDIQASGDTSSSPITSFHVRRTSVSTIQSTMTESSEAEKFPVNVSESLVPEKVDDVTFEDACPVNLLESTGKRTRLLRYVQPTFRMPSLTVPQVPRHVAPPPTKENYLGSVTILWSQPISALQILCSDGKWRWVKHIDNALVVNSGDAMDFLSGGFYKCTIHRVVQPPPDQRGLTRLGIFYFAMPHDDVKLVPRLDSPVLQRAGVRRRCSDDRAPTMKSWRQGRVRGYGFVQVKKREDGHEEEIVDGLPVTYFN